MKYNAENIAYIAGFFDGDGSVSIVHQKTRGKLYHVPYANITNTNRKSLDWVCNILKFGHVRKKTSFTTNNLPIFVWEQRNSKVKDFLELIMPYLIIKKQKVQLVIEFCKLREQVQYKPFNKKSLGWQDEWCDRLKLMNIKSITMLEKCKFHNESLRKEKKKELQ